MLFHLLMHIGKILDDRIRADLGKKNLHHGQGRILAALRRRGAMAQAEIARELGIQPATVAIALRRMERGGLIERFRDATD